MQTCSANSDGSRANPLAQQADLLCFSHLRWDFVTQRPQHLLRHAARDRRVFYWEEPLWHNAGELTARADGQPGMYLEIIEDSASLRVLRPHLSWGIDCDDGQRKLLAELMEHFKIERYVLWYYTPMALGFSSELKAEAVIYDCMDELSGFLGAPPELAQRETKLFEHADVVFTGGISLYEAKRLQHPNVHALPSSIDVSHCRSVADFSPTRGVLRRCGRTIRHRAPGRDS